VGLRELRGEGKGENGWKEMRREEGGRERGREGRKAIE